ncbi:hypothetical protein IF188_00245 [Microbacterium sp. NEAU-LLC]|uniref:S1 motif domain-containing protein n=1 Tax=Microbacterium helvum TaxID=2773713 RepID=A0ABR8NHF6_9MICO|nr:hypothetical protein [Microbacterium helvum]MBD3940126.1 hypothetical protein [Microbacterium helvum]
MAEHVRTTAEAVALAGRILGAREKPVVVLSTDPATDGFAIDADDVESGTQGVADLVLIDTGDLTRTLAAHLPDRAQVYGGAGRSYPVDFGADPDWRRSPLRFPGPRAATALVGDVLTHANAARLFDCKPASRRVAVTGVVQGFAGDERALVATDGHGPATISRELTYPPFPLDWVVRRGQRVAGMLDLDDHRLLVTEPAPDTAALLAAFAHHSVTLAFVTKVTPARATLLLHPAVEFTVRRDDVSKNPLDTVDLLLAEGDVVAVRVLHLSDGTIHLSLYDVDDDEAIVPPLALTTGGPPWLAQGRALLPEDADTHGELAELERRTPVPGASGAGAAGAVSEAPAVDAAAAEPDAPGVAEASPPTTARPVPGPGMRPAMPHAASAAGAASAATDAAADAGHADEHAAAVESRAPHGSALRSTQRALDTARAEIAGLKARLAEADADDSAASRLRARAATAESRLKEALVGRAELELRVRELDARQRAGTQALRSARKAAAASSAPGDDRATRRSRWSTDEAWVRHEIYLAWVDRVEPAERADHPLGDYIVGPRFAESLAPLDDGRFDKAMKAAVDAATGRIREVPGREAHLLRTGDGAGDPPTVRASDGAKCWRAYIEQKTAQARRIHYWILPGGTVELSRIVPHDDVQP